MSERLERVFRKTYWAEKRRDTLQAMADHFLEGKTHTLIPHVENDGREHVFVAADVIEPPPQVAMLIGEVAHAARSTLDHLAWALASRPNRKTAFPIWDGPRKDGNGNQIPLTIPGGVPKAVIKILKSVQPYGPGKRPIQSRLAQLRDLDDIDKHRVVVTTVASQAYSGFSFLTPVTCAWRFCPTWGILKNGEEVARFLFSDPCPEDQIEFDVRACISVSQIHPALDGQNIVSYLIGLIQTVRETAEMFDPYLKR